MKMLKACLGCCNLPQRTSIYGYLIKHVVRIDNKTYVPNIYYLDLKLYRYATHRPIIWCTCSVIKFISITNSPRVIRKHMNSNFPKLVSVISFNRKYIPVCYIERSLKVFRRTALNPFCVLMQEKFSQQ